MASLTGCGAVHHAAQPRILLYGDSLCSKFSAFYPAMQQEFPRAEIIPNGVVGAATWDRSGPLKRPSRWDAQGAMARTAPDYRNSGTAALWQRLEFTGALRWWKQPADVIIVLMGVNDFCHDRSTPPEWGWAALESIRDSAAAAGVPIFIGTPFHQDPTSPDMASQGGCSSCWSSWYVERLRDLVLRLSGADVIDFDEAVRSDEAERSLPDCLHPSPEAAQRMAKLVRLTICERRFQPRLRNICRE